MRRLLPYFQLCRIPAVFSAIADICCGWALTHRAPATLEPYPVLGLLVVASCGLYLAGMVLNDIFDREEDARDRPGRPIPSGRVSLGSAIRLAIILLMIGNLAALFAGTTSAIVAAILTVCVLAYDGILKNTVVAPLVMGSCRFLNILLGASAAGTLTDVFAMPQLAVALGMGLYITGVTIFSRQESQVSARWKLALGMGVLNLGLAILMGFVLNFPSPLGQTAVVALAAVVAVIDGRMLGAVTVPTPGRVQATVRTLLMSLITLNAIIIFHTTGQPALAIGVMAMLLPALYLGRFMSIT